MNAAAALGFVHRFLPARTESAPTLLLLHGTGGDEDDLIPLAKAIAPEAGVLSPRGKTLEGGMPRFFRRLAEGVFDQADLEYRTAELKTFITDAAGAYGFDPARLIAVGFSNGANIAASLLLRYTDPLGGAALIRAMVPFVPETANDLAGKAVLLLSGKRDPIANPAQAEQLRVLLEARNADVQLEWQDSGHELTQADMLSLKRWLQRFF